MSSFNLYDAVGFILLIFAVIHTYGGLYSDLPLTPSARATLVSMQTVHFPLNYAENCTWYGFYLGFGLIVTVFLIMSAIVSFTMGRAKRAIQQITVDTKDREGRGASREVLEFKRFFKAMAWTLFIANLGMCILSWRFFFPPPGVFSTVIAGLLGWEVLRLER